MSLLIRALGVWFLLLLAAIANGAVRQSLMVPSMGEHAGHVVSTVMLSFVIFAVGWLMSGFLDLVSLREAWTVGGLWLGLTLGFEVLGGHFLFPLPKNHATAARFSFLRVFDPSFTAGTMTTGHFERMRTPCVVLPTRRS